MILERIENLFQLILQNCGTSKEYIERITQFRKEQSDYIKEVAKLRIQLIQKEHIILQKERELLDIIKI